ncbi:putative hydro-lyase [Granulosicoccus sp. 3-233]|uniref:putative hydro-lyase n=1 Tax=Granulosicoccus sp. 3-233 TaxID=3417969 RepID=UPI003D34C988
MNSDLYSRLRHASVSELREAIRQADYQGHTAGMASGFLQANLVILPAEHALDFMRFCQRNPKPCPLVGVSDTGNAMMHTLGPDIDIRTDVPAYYIYRHGALAETVTDLNSYWQPDHVAFALGCSFTFENALIEAGIPIWHIEHNKTVPMYRSSIMTEPAGVFGGEMVVTMRAVEADRVDEVIELCRRFPLAHGAPVHVGDARDIGISDLQKPDWGDAPPPLGKQTSVFWACGVTPQQVLMRAGLPLSITHKPGHMLITDIDDQAEVPVYSG